MVYVKICGIKEDSALPGALQAGVNAVGFVVGVPSSPRNLSESDAARLIQLVPPTVISVIVISVYALNEVEYYLRRFSADYVQVHLQVRFPRFEELSSLPLERIIPAFDLGQAQALDENCAGIQKILARVPYILIDGSRGTSQKIDNLAAAAAFIQRVRPCKVVLAGGLNASNISAIIQKVAPYGVDVSSGVESAPGIKDNEKLKAFITNARENEHVSTPFQKNLASNFVIEGTVKKHG